MHLLPTGQALARVVFLESPADGVVSFEFVAQNCSRPLLPQNVSDLTLGRLGRCSGAACSIADSISFLDSGAILELKRAKPTNSSDKYHKWSPSFLLVGTEVAVCGYSRDWTMSFKSFSGASDVWGAVIHALRWISTEKVVISQIPFFWRSHLQLDTEQSHLEGINHFCHPTCRNGCMAPGTPRRNPSKESLQGILWKSQGILYSRPSLVSLLSIFEQIQWCPHKMGSPRFQLRHLLRQFENCPDPQIANCF